MQRRGRFDEASPPHLHRFAAFGLLSTCLFGFLPPLENSSQLGQLSRRHRYCIVHRLYRLDPHPWFPSQPKLPVPLQGSCRHVSAAHSGRLHVLMRLRYSEHPRIHGHPSNQHLMRCRPRSRLSAGAHITAKKPPVPSCRVDRKRPAESLSAVRQSVYAPPFTNCPCVVVQAQWGTSGGSSPEHTITDYHYGLYVTILSCSMFMSAYSNRRKGIMRERPTIRMQPGETRVPPCNRSASILQKVTKGMRPSV
ncbi:hypothetical protein EJ04DRAFT_50586 [Polyplosphaeria fusca]|uniref:Uncharacterized protein n=1 Tax=Polyplosphaeria fusca TaxID=682080 RepID=A0A9P4QR44_9PLEO|nr:hypothetical protein EJ04DRAFT_50586 [Polyplosphaeria fusca]